MRWESIGMDVMCAQGGGTDIAFHMIIRPLLICLPWIHTEQLLDAQPVQFQSSV